MPIYEFKCDDCGEVTTEFRRIGDTLPAACEKCGSKNTQKIMSAFSSGKSASGSGGSVGCGTSGGG